MVEIKTAEKQQDSTITLLHTSRSDIPAMQARLAHSVHRRSTLSVRIKAAEKRASHLFDKIFHPLHERKGIKVALSSSTDNDDTVELIHTPSAISLNLDPFDVANECDHSTDLSTTVPKIWLENHTTNSTASAGPSPEITQVGLTAKELEEEVLSISSNSDSSVNCEEWVDLRYFGDSKAQQARLQQMYKLEQKALLQYAVQTYDDDEISVMRDRLDDVELRSVGGETDADHEKDLRCPCFVHEHLCERSSAVFKVGLEEREGGYVCAGPHKRLVSWAEHGAIPVKIRWQGWMARHRGRFVRMLEGKDAVRRGRSSRLMSS